MTVECHNCAVIYGGGARMPAVAAVHMPGFRRRYKPLCQEHREAFWLSHKHQTADLRDPSVLGARPGAGFLLSKLKAVKEVPVDDQGLLEWLAADAVMSA